MYDIKTIDEIQDICSVLKTNYKIKDDLAIRGVSVELKVSGSSYSIQDSAQRDVIRTMTLDRIDLLERQLHDLGVKL